MIHHTDEGFQTDISRSSYTRYYWKPNHMAYGKHWTPGCWQPTVCRQKSTYLANALNAISAASDLNTEEARRMFEHSDSAGATVSIAKGQITISDHGSLLIFDIKTSQEFRRFLVKKGWLKDAPMSVEVITSTSHKKGRKAKGTAKGNGDNNLPSASTDNTYLNQYIRPAHISYEFWMNASDYMRALMFFGLPVEDIDKFRDWDKRHWKRQKKILLQERIKIFQKGGIIANPTKQAEAKRAPSALSHGLKKADLEQYQEWFKTEHKAGHTLGVKESVMVARFYTRHTLQPESKVVDAVSKKLIELHDAHVIVMRRRRKNRLKELRRITVREGQDRFKRAVLANFDNCAITGLNCGLEAAHIIPDATHEYMHPENGLLLAGFIHKAFDDLLFAINPKNMMVFVLEVYRPYLNIHGRSLNDGKIWCISRGALAYHWERFKELNCLGDDV